MLRLYMCCQYPDREQHWWWKWQKCVPSISKIDIAIKCRLKMPSYFPDLQWQLWTTVSEVPVTSSSYQSHVMTLAWLATTIQIFVCQGLAGNCLNLTFVETVTTGKSLAKVWKHLAVPQKWKKKKKDWSILPIRIMKHLVQGSSRIEC